MDVNIAVKLLLLDGSDAIDARIRSLYVVLLGLLMHD